MDTASILYLSITFGLFVVFLVIVARTLKSSRKDKLEEAKHRMLEDD